MTIKKVGNDVENLHFNTAVSQLMIYSNHLQTIDKIPREFVSDLVKIIAPFVPHLAEELWSLLGNKNSLAYENWPDYDEKLTQTDEVTVVVQVNGKLRANITLAKDSDETTAVDAALALERVANYTSKGSIVKTVYVANRLLNFVVK